MKSKSIVFFILSCLVILTGCQTQSGKALKVAATSVPHAEILEQIGPDLKEKGIDLEIIVVEDYNTPNRALSDGDVDANFFQHQPFLESQIKDFGYHLTNLAAIHIEPMSLYSKKIKTLDQLQPNAIIAIASDPTNQARALCLLQQVELIKIKRCDSKTSLLDVTENPQHLKLIEIDSPLLSRSLDDVDIAAISTNFALQAGLSPQTDALASENAQSLFANILVVRSGEENREDVQQLKESLTSDKIKKFILEKYQGAVMPAF